jgi:hypothetical protein
MLSQLDSLLPSFCIHSPPLSFTFFFGALSQLLTIKRTVTTEEATASVDYSSMLHCSYIATAVALTTLLYILYIQLDLEESVRFFSFQWLS